MKDKKYIGKIFRMGAKLHLTNNLQNEMNADLIWGFSSVYFKYSTKTWLIFIFLFLEIKDSEVPNTASSSNKPVN